MKSLIYSLLILGVIASCVALKCFVCNSATDKACNDHLEAGSPALREAFSFECEENENMTAPFCRKVKEYIEIHSKSKSAVRVHRECGYQRREEYDCYQKRSEDYVMDVCQCDDNLCNGTPAALTASLLTVAFPLLTRFM